MPARSITETSHTENVVRGALSRAQESREDAPTSLRCRASLRLREGRWARSITLHSITLNVSRSPFLAA